MIEIRSIIHRPVIEATKNSLSHDANFETKKKKRRQTMKTFMRRRVHTVTSAIDFYFPSKEK